MPGVSAVGIERKDSSGDTASVFADRIPYLSQLKYLVRMLIIMLAQGLDKHTFHDGL